MYIINFDECQTIHRSEAFDKACDKFGIAKLEADLLEFMISQWPNDANDWADRVIDERRDKCKFAQQYKTKFIE